MPPDSLILPSTIPASLPVETTPPNFWRLGWYGINLALPDAWNLRFHQGTAHAGTLLFSDLAAIRLEIRWKTPRRAFNLKPITPPTFLNQTITRIARRFSAAPPMRIADAAYRLNRPNQTLLLAADAQRCYEILWPNAPEHIDLITQDFLATAPSHAHAAEWFWNIYGATGYVPSGARLKTATMLPGECRLTFSHCPTKHETIILASHSLADRLLHNRSLRDWARDSISLIRANAGGEWQESEAGSTYQVHMGKRFLHSRSTVLRVDLAHDRAGNRLQWIAHYGRTPSAGLKRKNKSRSE